MTSFPKSRHRYVLQTGLFSRNVCTPLPVTAHTKLKRFTGLKKWLKLVKFTGLTSLRANIVKNNHTKIKGACISFLIHSFKNVHTCLLFFLILLFHISLLSSLSASSFSLPHSLPHSSSFSSSFSLNPPPPYLSSSSSPSSLKCL